MRIAAILAVASLSLLGLVPAHAGDTASLDVLGFTPDGGVFAFEEYGVQDGSGFPYANRFYIDTATDEFVASTPIRVLIEDEAATVDAARAQAQTQGEKLHADAILEKNRGDLVAFNAVTENSADPYRIAANPRPVFAPIDPPLEFRLEEFDVLPTQQCEGIGDLKGFKLLRLDSTPGGQTKLLHEDTSVPLSRGCPQGYRLGGIQTFYPDAGEPVYAVLVAVRRYGFEGPDFRWMAVTGKL